MGQVLERMQVRNLRLIASRAGLLRLKREGDLSRIGALLAQLPAFTRGSLVAGADLEREFF
jgi:hypothetical protein